VAVAVVTAAGLAVARARWDAPGPQAAVLVATAKPPAPHRSATTVAAARPTTTTARPAPTTTTGAPVPPTTTTTMPRTTTTVRTRATCLALADVNHYAVVTANARWFEEQVRELSLDRVVRARQYEALRIEEAWALKEIDAQYAIDRSNCYLD
jgi:hypothetical protein